jgi:SAM-dependent methyltransferase
MTKGQTSRRGRIPPVGGFDLGDFDRLEPVSRGFGGDRGTPIDRYFIERFLARHAADIRGRVIEIGEDLYTRRFGAGRVDRSDILDAPAANNPNATIVADLADCPHLPEASVDCFILTQTLHMIYDVHGVLASAHRMLAPGGVVLATVPGISQIDAGSGRDTWFWYMTPACAERFFRERFPPEAVETEQFGNVLAAAGFLQGLALEEIDAADLDHKDPLYPVITGVRARKPG